MAYVSGPLTGLSDMEHARCLSLYERIADVCAEFGFLGFLPHKYGDPKAKAHLTPEQIDKQDRTAVTQSRIVIAYVGLPSHGAGIEIEMAHHSHKPVILLFEKERLEQRMISRLVLGAPAVIDKIGFNSEDEAMIMLRSSLDSFCLKLDSSGLPDPLWPGTPVESM
ncbi:nucleoside 2-deoxyribosyltransferase [Patescibacteria group bacterium]|nr:nucleoside 2-deoxyribosyltransferase [Patescibacteria group bacterium]